MKEISALVAVCIAIIVLSWGLWRFTKWVETGIGGTTHNRLERIERKIDVILDSDVFLSKVKH